MGRPRIDAEELDRERGVVIQEINRAYDQPSTVAEYLIDRAAFGEHPLGRTVLGPEENLRSFTREAIVAFRERRWAGARGGAFLVGNLDHLPREAELHELLRALPRAGRARALRAGAGVRAADAGGAARDQPVAPAHDLPARGGRDRPPPARGPGDLLDAARRLDGLAAVRRDPRETGPVLLGVRDRPLLRRRPDPAARLGPRLEQVHRGVHPHARDRGGAARGRAHARRRSPARAPTPPGGWCSRSRTPNAVARYAASQSIVFGEEIDPDAAIAALDAVTFDEVREVAAGVTESWRSPAWDPTAPRSSERVFWEALAGVHARRTDARGSPAPRGRRTRRHVVCERDGSAQGDHAVDRHTRAVGDLRRHAHLEAACPAASRAAWAA